MSINPEEIAFALITYYPKWHQGKLRNISQTDKIRGDLALKFIRKAANAGFRLIVADGKSSKTFQKQLRNFSNIVYIKKINPKRSPAKRQAFRTAAKLPGTKVIVTTEPEKVSLLDSISTFVAPLLENKADIVVLKRNEELFKKTYPDYMYQSETEGNHLYNEQLKIHHLQKEGEELDMFFGPRAFLNHPEVLSLFLKKFHFQKYQKPLEGYYDPEEYSNTLYFPIVTALRKGFRVKSVEIPFFYPVLQKKNETIGAKKFFVDKRHNQRVATLIDLMYFLTYFS